MTRGTECECSSMEVNGLIQVRQDTPLLKSLLETGGTVVEGRGSRRMTRETLPQGHSQTIHILYHVIVAKDIPVEFELQTPPTGSVKARRRPGEKVRFHRPCSPRLLVKCLTNEYYI